MKPKLIQRERVYFFLRVLFTAVIIFAVAAGLMRMFGNASYEGEFSRQGTIMIATFVVYGLIVALFFVFFKWTLIGQLKGNGVEVTTAQFPEVYSAYRKVCDSYGIANAPKLFLVQHGGLLNAFATKFAGKHFVAVYSDVMALAMEDPEAVQFILAHELWHVKSGHVSKNFWTLPSVIVPFLQAAWSRACETNCDLSAAAFSAEGAEKGLMLLAAGPALYRNVQRDEFLKTAAGNNTFVVKFTGIFQSHPYLSRRLKTVRERAKA